MAQLAPGWITAPVRTDGVGGAVLGDGVVAATLLVAGATGVVMTGAVLLGGMTGGSGVLGVGVFGVATEVGGGAASVNSKASTDSCVNVIA